MTIPEFSLKLQLRVVYVSVPIALFLFSISSLCDLVFDKITNIKRNKEIIKTNILIKVHGDCVSSGVFLRLFVPVIFPEILVTMFRPNRPFCRKSIDSMRSNQAVFTVNPVVIFSLLWLLSHFFLIFLFIL